MSLVSTPLRQSSKSPASRSTVRAMEVGQYVIAVALTLVGIIRATGEGVAPTVATISGLAIVGAHTVGTLIPSRTNSTTVIVLWLLGFTAIWIATVAVSSAFIWLAFLLWLLAGHLLPVTWGIVYSLIVFVVATAAPILHHGSTTYANVFGPLIGGIFAFGISRGYLQLLKDAQERERFVHSLTQAQQEMAELQDELALAHRHSGAISERTRLSREIHDTVAQGLSSIRLLAHAAATPTSDPESARAFEQIGALARESLADVRRIVAALAPAELEHSALSTALDQLLVKLAEETGIETALHIDPSLPALSSDADVALLRSAQSALANVRLHSGAQHVTVSLSDAGDAIRLDIMDDGRGFDAAAWEQESNVASASFGIRFMRSRLRELGGGIDIESAPGEGTAISIHIPHAFEEQS